MPFPPVPSLKQKLLDALGITLDDLDEHILVDILLSAYAANKRRIEELQGENAHERELIHVERERMCQEHNSMRSNPLHCVSSDFYFKGKDRKLCVQVRNGSMRVLERDKGFDFIAQQLSADEWGRL